MLHGCNPGSVYVCLAKCIICCSKMIFRSASLRYVGTHVMWISVLETCFKLKLPKTLSECIFSLRVIIHFASIMLHLPPLMYLLCTCSLRASWSSRRQHTKKETYFKLDWCDIKKEKSRMFDTDRRLTFSGCPIFEFFILTDKSIKIATQSRRLKADFLM